MPIALRFRHLLDTLNRLHQTFGVADLHAETDC